MENLLFLGVPKSWAHYSRIIMCLNIGTPNNHHFPFGENGKVVVLDVPILKHFRVNFDKFLLFNSNIYGKQSTRIIILLQPSLQRDALWKNIPVVTYALIYRLRITPRDTDWLKNAL